MRTLTYKMIEEVGRAVENEIKRLGEYGVSSENNTEKIGLLEDFVSILNEELPVVHFGTGKIEDKKVSVGPIYQVDQ